MACTLLIQSLIIVLSDDYFSHIKPQTSLETQQKAAQDVIYRLIPSYANRFIVEITSRMPTNSFQIIKNENSTYVSIRASSGVAACKGFYHYLKYYLKGHISWSGQQLHKIPSKFPNVFIESKSLGRFIYYQNVCTWSYSFVWWTWNEWRRHIDWMALMGINLSLAPINEKIWTTIYRKIGLTEKEIDQHFSGPAFLAWQRMGNIRGWGGILSQKYKSSQLKLQKQIIQAQRELGMIVALPGFAGHVPISFQRIFPNANFTKATRWNHFEDIYCCPLFLDPSDNLFTYIGKMYLSETIKEFGSDHIYFADPFNELKPISSDPSYLGNTSLGIFRTMQFVDKNAIWLMQGWMFVLNPFWVHEAIEAYLTSVPLGRMLILDLQSDQYPEYEITKSYFGQPFIWNMLHNFGGTLGMHGSVNIVNKRITEAANMPQSTMIGVGITPEGIYQNYPIYEFTLERAWSDKELNITNWFDYYTIVRYGIEDENLQNSWRYLLNSVYNYNGLIKLHGKYTICRRPSIKLSPWTWYNPILVRSAWSNMLKSGNLILRNHNLYKHDLVDLTRQCLQILGDKLYLTAISEFKQKNLQNFEQISKLFIDLLEDLEKILQTNEHFLLGKWLEGAKNFINNSNIHEMELYEYNARNQITLWGPNGEIVDYATKQWSGIVEDFFIPRWKLFFNELRNCLNNNKTFNDRKFKTKVLTKIEYPFTMAKKIYPTISMGDTYKIANELYFKWLNYWN